MLVPLLDLQQQFRPLRAAILGAIEDIADNQQFILGPAVEGFEDEIRHYCRANFAVGVSSGTDALLAILMALGIGPGDAVITSPYSFFATAGGIARVGAAPVFIDIDPRSYNMSGTALDHYLTTACQRDRHGALLNTAGQRVRAIMPVHLFGLACDMDPILELAARYDLPVIEDAAQALGAEYPRKNQAPMRAGAIGDFGYFSFFPSKNLGAFGDAGMVVCRDEAMAEKIRTIRNHGMEERYYHRFVGGNFRLDALQAAVLRVKLPHLDTWSEARRMNAALYGRLFGERGLGDCLALPIAPYATSGAINHHIYNQYVVRTSRRDALCSHLAAQGVGHAIYYPVPLHLQECFAPLGYRKGDFPEAEKAARETLALPIFPELTPEQQSHVVTVIEKFLREGHLS